MRIPTLLFLLAMPLAGGDFDDTPEIVHSMGIRTEVVDSFPVVMHYGKVRPDFADRAENPYRTRQSLDGPWRFRFDPQNIGLREQWAISTKPEGWTAVTVPHCWDMMPGGRFWDWSDHSVSNPPFYDGVAWYCRAFEAPAQPGKARRLEFLGIPQRVSIFLNGEQIARHEGGGQPFSIDVTDKLLDGKNTLAVRIVRPPNYREKPDGDGFEEIESIHGSYPKAPDNWPYAGIPRSVSLVTEDPAALRKILIRTSKGKVQAAVCISNEGKAPRTVSVALASPALEEMAAQSITLAPGQVRVLRFTAKAKPGTPQWTPANPAVHTLTATASENGAIYDTLRSSFGLRDFRIAGERFVLNGKPVFLKGMAFYEEHPERGNALTAEDHQRIFKLITDAGANFARLQVAERHPLTYELADQQGIMLCAEWGGFWYREKSMDAQTKDARSLYQSLARCAIWDLMNHPSVVLWGIHNESHQFCPEYEPFVKKGHELVDAHDWQQRPVTWAAWHPTKGEPHFEHADAVGFNEYRGAIDSFDDLEPDIQQVLKDNPGKPIIIMENGAWSKLGNRGSKKRQNTEDWHADLLRRQHKVLTRHSPPLAGYTYWLLQDYRSRKPYTGRKDADGWSRMGLYTPDGQPKLVRDTFRDLVW